MEEYKWAIVLCGIVIFLVIWAISSDRNRKKILINKLIKNWGKLNKKNITPEELEQIKHFFDNYSEGENIVDDITWHDLDMDRLFKAINTTNSSVGQECLYRMLRVLIKDKKLLDDREAKIKYFSENEENRVKAQYLFSRMGYCKSISYFDYIYMLSQVRPGNNLMHILGNIFNIAAIIILIFVNAAIGILLVIVAVGFSVVSYYKSLAEIKPYFMCVKIIAKMLGSSAELRKLGIDILAEDYKLLEHYEKELGFLANKSAFISSSSSLDGSLVSVLLDYFKMFTHIDIIMFNGIVNKLEPLADSIILFSKTMGDIESCIAIASFRKYMDRSNKPWTLPVMNAGTDMKLECEELTHPLIEKAVANSIDAKKSILITGSNASGKSTFIKTVAINSILAQTINTVCAKSFNSNYCKVYSSMALTDNLEGNESYYMVEIRSLKRIIDTCKDETIPVLCMVDEVLRGTNTIERIAASSQILKSLAKKHVLMFAATHDIELTTILDECYDNYHFQEKFSENDITFDYKIYEGPAVTRNAIKLLSIIGYDADIVKKAEELALELLKN